MAQILVVDDEVGIRELLSEILADEGHQVTLAESAGEARRCRERQRPDLVLLDIWMPDTDGITLLKEWAASGQLTMPVVMMSGHGTIETAVEATRIGALDFLEKPIALQRLLATVKRALRNPEAAAAPELAPDDVHDELLVVGLGRHPPHDVPSGRVARARVKRVCYLSMEFLLGRSLINALSTFEDELLVEVRETLHSLGHDIEHIAAEEEDPGLGNGGLGRLAACFLDSLATLGYAATGYGIRYDYGIFTQVIEKDGAQREVASSWLGFHNFWESGQGAIRHRVRFGGQCRATRNEQGRVRYEWVDTQDVWAVGYDLLIPGNRSFTVNHLRLWSARALQPFHIEDFNSGNYPAAVAVAARLGELPAVQVQWYSRIDETRRNAPRLQFNYVTPATTCYNATTPELFLLSAKNVEALRRSVPAA